MIPASKLCVLFVGHFTPLSSSKKIYSAAGSLTQQEILNCLERNKNVTSVEAMVMTERPSFPNGAIWNKEYIQGNIRAVSYINVFLIRNIWFSIHLFWQLLAYRPALCVQYNSYLFENLALLVYRFFFGKVKLAIIIQDIAISSERSGWNIKGLPERWGLNLAKKFDIIAPITRNIIDDFNLSKQKSYVFQGGVTGRALSCTMEVVENDLEDIAVFAGALERYNGVDLLVQRWIERKIETTLHVFGRGSLSDLIISYASNAKNIVFHGLCSEDQVMAMQSKAKWLISLRYSAGLNQNYFFPSKFFNLLALRGNVLVNRFNNIPEILSPYLVYLDDNLSDLTQNFLTVHRQPPRDHLERRHTVLREEFSWNSLCNELVRRAI